MSSTYEGAGEIRLSRAPWASVGNAPVQDLQATGLGSLEASRGGLHVQVTCPGDSGPTVVQGEMDTLCGDFSTDSWSTDSWSTDSWSTDSWSTDSWSTDSWSTDKLVTDSWSTDSWSTDSWSSASWDSAPAPSSGQ